MLELRLTCENCNKALPPASLEACICTYECTFCSTSKLRWRLCPRPLRPLKNWKGDNFLGKDPASTEVKYRPVDPMAHAEFSAAIRSIPPEER